MLFAKAFAACIVLTVGLAQPSQHILKDARLDEWNLNQQPDPDSTDHLVFDTLASALQHWAHTRYRNGHNIIAGTVAPGTLLYHGRHDYAIPTTPEWTSTDAEHAYLFCGDDENPTGAGCWLLTLVTTRPLNILYFDGSSAAKMDTGAFDTQDILAYGQVTDGNWTKEIQRLDTLCGWGSKYGLDGFVRMEMDFEIMLCNFTNGLEVSSFFMLRNNIPTDVPWPGAPGRRPDEPPGRRFPPSYDTLEDTTAPNQGVIGISDPDVIINDAEVETLVAGGWHDRYPGDTRIQLDLASLLSFYDTQLAPSLVAARRGVERWDHRVANISSNAVQAARAQLEDYLSSRPKGSGVDWLTLVRTIVKRFAERLELLRYLLAENTRTERRMKKVQIALLALVAPYRLFGAVPLGNARDSQWAAPIYQECAVAHTAYIAYSRTLQERMTPGERLLLRAVEGTTKETCRVVVKMWAAGIEAGLEEEDATADESVPLMVALLSMWRAELPRLMSWLDWSVWIKCPRPCGPEEFCYLPTWPFFTGRNPERRLPGDRERPEPRCVRRLQPRSLSHPFF